MDNNYKTFFFLDEKNQNQDFTFSAKIENKILKSLKLEPKLFQRFLKQQNFLRISFSIFYAYETDVKIKIFDFY